MFGSFPDDLLEQFRHDYAERGKPCGASHISADKICRIGGQQGYTSVVESIKKEVGDRFDDAHEKIFRERYAGVSNPKELAAAHRKVIKDLDNDVLDAKEGVLNAIRDSMRLHLEANMATSQGAKREAELAAMGPEERRRAQTADAIKRGIKNKVVKGGR